MNILVIDDDEVIRETLCELIIEMAGHSVMEAGSGEEALEIATLLDEATPIHAAFVDNKMHAMNGIDTIIALREHYPVTKYVFCSGAIVSQFPPEGKPDFLLPKPFDFQHLLELLTAIESDL